VGPMSLANRGRRRRVWMRYHPRARVRPLRALIPAAVSQRGPRLAHHSTMPLPQPAAPAAVDLGGRVILVTGASGGLGMPLALAFAAHGATVVLHGRNVGRLEAIYDAIAAAGGAQPSILPLDLAVAATEDFGHVAGALRAQQGRLDGLVHTAAFLGPLGPVEHQTFDAWQTALRVNVSAAMALTRALLPLLVQSSDGAIVLTEDTRGVAPHAYWGGYAASKAALGAFATMLADELEHRSALRVNTVVPGPIRSPLRNRTHPGEDKSALAPPEALVPLYLYLVAGQPKAESGARIDAQAWLAGQPASTPLVAADALRP